MYRTYRRMPYGHSCGFNGGNKMISVSIPKATLFNICVKHHIQPNVFVRKICEKDHFHNHITYELLVHDIVEKELKYTTNIEISINNMISLDKRAITNLIKAFSLTEPISITLY